MTLILIHFLSMFTCEQSQIVVLGLFFARLLWFSEQNLDAISTEAIRVRVGAVGYACFIVFRCNDPFESNMH